MSTASDKIEQATFWPETMLEDLTRHAQRLDRSLSWCAQLAWKIAGEEISKLPGNREHPTAQDVLDSRYQASYDGKQVKQTLFFPLDVIAELRAASDRQDRSISWLVQHAWCLAISEIEKTPAS